jgi:RHS repeat-associated protein
MNLKEFLMIAALLLGVLALPGAAQATWFGFSLPPLGDNPADADFNRKPVLVVPLVPLQGPVQEGENAALAAALKAMALDGAGDETLQHLANFVAENPTSRWVPAVQVNRGLMLVLSGYFQRAMVAHEVAWEKGKEETGAVKPLVDRALGELMYLYAGAGDKTRLGQQLERMQNRRPEGTAARLYEAAHQTLDAMEKMPEETYRCGSYALQRILEFQDPKAVLEKSATFEAVRAQEKGLSLAQVGQIAASLSMDMRPVRWVPGSTVPSPAVIHTKLGHYAAILEFKRGLYHISDPLAHSEAWVSKAALEEEATGYFLLGGVLPEGWKELDGTEAGGIWGRGQTNTPPSPPGGGCGNGGMILANNCPPPRCNPDGGGCDDKDINGMARALIDIGTTSLMIEDIPLAYKTSAGPSVDMWLMNHQKTPQTPPYSNVGANWSFRWSGCIEYSVTCPSSFANFTLAPPGGGIEPFTPGDYTQHTRSGIQVTKWGDSDCAVGLPVEFVRQSPDGWKQTYGHFIAIAGGARVLLTSITDPQGNSATVQHNDQHRITTVTDATGLITNFTYASEIVGDPAYYRITRVTDPFGRHADFSYDSNHLLSITDQIGITSYFEYDAKTLTSGSSGATTIYYSGDWVSEIRTPYGVTMIDYTGTGNGIEDLELTDPSGQRQHVRFSNGNLYSDRAMYKLPPSVVDVNLVNFAIFRNTYFWDATAMAEVPSGTVPSYEKATVYHWPHQSENLRAYLLTGLKKPLENTVFYRYEETRLDTSALQGMMFRPSSVARLVKGLEGGDAEQLYRYSYNPFGKVTSSIDPKGRMMHYVYTPDGLDPVETRDGSWNLLERRVYNAHHRPVTVWDGAKQPWTYTYNDLGQVTSAVSPLGLTTSYEYGPAGWLSSITPPDPAAAVQFTYDGQGRVHTRTDAVNGVLTYDYDNADRPTTVTYADGTKETYVYDKLDLDKYTDRQGRTTDYDYDANRRLTKITDPENRTTNMTYCSCGSIESLTDPAGNTTHWEYDLENRLIKKTYNDMSAYEYNYDSLGPNLVSVKDPKGQATGFRYNLDDRLRVKEYGNTLVPTASVSFAYDDPLGRLTEMADSTGKTTYTYHPFGYMGGGKLRTVKSPLGSAFAETVYTYDKDGRIINRSIDAEAETYNYDPATGRLQTVTNALGAFGYTYDPGTGQLRVVSYPNGQTAQYDYWGPEKSVRLKTLTNSGTAGLLSKFDYDYALMGDITQWTQQLGPTAATAKIYSPSYDRTSQLTGADINFADASPSRSVSFVYDSAGNRTDEYQKAGGATTLHNHFGVNGLNQLTDITPDPHEVKGYTSRASAVTVNGNHVSADGSEGFETSIPAETGGSTPLTILAVAPDGTVKKEKKVIKNLQTYEYDANGNLVKDSEKSYVWDADDRLIRVSLLNQQPEGKADTVEMEYDGFGRRIRIVEKHGETVLSDKRFLWDTGEIVEERNSAGPVVNKRFYAQGYQIASGDNQGTYFYAKDHLGSIREVTDSAGTVMAKYDYDVWGRQTKLSGNQDADFGYTGFYVSRSTGLDLTWFRAYSAEMGRWLSRDPLAETMGANLYSMVFNNSMNLIDVMGLCPTPTPTPTFSPTPTLPAHNPEYPFLFVGPNEMTGDQKKAYIFFVLEPAADFLIESIPEIGKRTNMYLTLLQQRGDVKRTPGWELQITPLIPNPFSKPKLTPVPTNTATPSFCPLP